MNAVATTAPDLALLVDGLRAEREQGITIDVAYRYFATPRRTFILADTPGHVQYTRNTVTGASTADVAVILVDARSGVVEQTKRHAAVAALLRVSARRAGGQQDGSRRLRRGRLRPNRHRLRRRGAFMSLDRFTPIPVAALSATTWWTDRPRWTGTPDRRCWNISKSVEPARSADVPARFPVQMVLRPRTAEHPDYRGYAGRVEAGALTRR